MGGAARDFPLAFYSLPYMVLMLVIQPASILASKPLTPISLALSAISLSFFFFLLYVAFIVQAQVLPPPISKLLLLMLVEHLGD